MLQIENFDPSPLIEATNHKQQFEMIKMGRRLEQMMDVLTLVQSDVRTIKYSIKTTPNTPKVQGQKDAIGQAIGAKLRHAMSGITEDEKELEITSRD